MDDYREFLDRLSQALFVMTDARSPSLPSEHFWAVVEEAIQQMPEERPLKRDFDELMAEWVVGGLSTVGLTRELKRIVQRISFAAAAHTPAADGLLGNIVFAEGFFAAAVSDKRAQERLRIIGWPDEDRSR